MSNLQVQDTTVGIDRLGLPFLKEYNAFIPEKSPTTLRIATWNIHEWKKEYKTYGGEDNRVEVSNILRELQPDVIGFQEVIGEPPKILQDWKKASCVADQGSHGQKLKNELFVRPSFNIDSCKSLDIGHDRCMVVVKLRVLGVLVIIATAHFEVRDGYSRLNNVKKAEKILEDLSYQYQTANIILMGDFNSYRRKDYADNCEVDPNCVELRELKEKRQQAMNIFETTTYLESKGWTDSFVKISNELGIVDNSSYPANTTFYGGRIDFVYTHPEFDFDAVKLSGTYVYFSNASDHIAVIADFDIIDGNKEVLYSKLQKIFFSSSLKNLLKQQTVERDIQKLLSINQYNKTWTYVDGMVIDPRQVLGFYKGSGYSDINRFLGYNSIGDKSRPTFDKAEIEKRLNLCSVTYLDNYVLSEPSFEEKLNRSGGFIGRNRMGPHDLLDYFQYYQKKSTKKPKKKVYDFMQHYFNVGQIDEIINEMNSFTKQCVANPIKYLEPTDLQDYFEHDENTLAKIKTMQACKTTFLLKNLIYEKSFKKYLDAYRMEDFARITLYFFLHLHENRLPIPYTREIQKMSQFMRAHYSSSEIDGMINEMNNFATQCINNPSEFIQEKPQNTTSDYTRYAAVIMNKHILSLPRYDKELVVYRSLFNAGPEIINDFVHTLSKPGKIMPIYHFQSTGIVPYNGHKSEYDYQNVFLKIIIPLKYPFIIYSVLTTPTLEQSEVILPYTLDHSGKYLNYGYKAVKYETKKSNDVSFLHDTQDIKVTDSLRKCKNELQLPIIGVGENGVNKICVHHYFTVTLAPLTTPIRVNDIPTLKNVSLPKNPLSILERDKFNAFDPSLIKTSEDFNRLAQYLNVTKHENNVDAILQEHLQKYEDEYK